MVLCYNTKNSYLNFYIIVAIATNLFTALPLTAQQLSNPTRISIRGVTIKGSSLISTLAELPGSVTVVDQKSATTQDFLQQQIIDIPNLNFAGGSSRPKFFQIRGVGDLEQYEGAPNSSVAVILDEVDVTGVGAATTLFDVDQIEVHRGPQAIRFGSSSLGGAINLDTVAPSSFNKGQSIFSLGNDELFSVGTAVGGGLAKISDKLSGRIAIYHHSQNGFRKNDFLSSDSTNERDELTARAKLRLQANDKLFFELGLVNTELNNGYDSFAIDNSFTTQSDRPGNDKESFKLLSLKSIWLNSDLFKLTSISSIYQNIVDYSFDGDWGNNQFWQPYAPYDYFSASLRKRVTLAQQFRISSDNFMVGAFFQDLNEDTSTEEYADNQIFDTLNSDYSAVTYATFADYKYLVTDNLELSLGSRVEFRDTNYFDSREANFAPKDTMYGYRTALNYKYDNTNNYYLLVSRGFRGGGFNSGLSVPQNLREYNPESLINFELGNRRNWIEGKIVSDVTLFYNRRNNQQLKFSFQDNPTDPLSFTYLTDNAGTGDAVGIEALIQYQILPEILFSLNGSLIDTKIKSTNKLVSIVNGRDQSHTPPWQYSANATYQFNEYFWSNVGIAGRGAFYFDDSNNAKSNPYHLVKVETGYNINGNSKVTLWVQNLFDQKYAVRGFFFGNEPPDFPNKKYVQLGDPRQLGITMKYVF
jgi:iron complex outermembrane recepter protein